MKKLERKRKAYLSWPKLTAFFQNKREIERFQNGKANSNLSRNKIYHNEMPIYKYNLLYSLEEAFGVKGSRNHSWRLHIM